MSRISRKMLILGVFCAAGLLALIPGYMLSSRNSNITSVQSALLNPKYASKVDEITLSFPSGATYTFSKGVNLQKNEAWTCTTGEGTQFPANAAILDQLIERAATTVSMAEVSDSYSAWAAFGLSDDQAINMSFAGRFTDGGKVYSSLFFGFENADGSMLYIRNDRKSTSWRIPNDYSSYLSESASIWADQHLLPTGSLSESDPTRTCILAEAEGESFRIYNNADNGSSFDSLVHTLLALRSSELYEAEHDLLEPDQWTKSLTLTLEGSAGDAYGMNIYTALYGDEQVFIVKNFGIVSAGEAGYCQVISTWTWNKIIESLSTTAR